MNESRLLNRRQTAAYLGIAWDTCGTMMRQGRLPAFKLPASRAWRVREADLAAWLDELAGEAKTRVKSGAGRPQSR